MSYLVIGLAGTALSRRERDWLAREEVGGVIVFRRNFASPAQFAELLASVRRIDAHALVLVDQEGGRVQRIGPPASVLPPLRVIGRLYDRDRQLARQLAQAHAGLMASEMLALGMDLSLAPVLDLDAGSEVIGDRAFHARPEVVAELGATYVGAMHAAGMAACGKHFPGHGSVAPDTHFERAVDERPLDLIRRRDLVPFALAGARGLDALMTSHVVYPCLDPRAAGYSKRWIVEILRGELGFRGVVISDDLGMAAACEAGAYADRLRATLVAGADLLLVCRPEDVEACCAEASSWPPPGEDRRAALRARRSLEWSTFAGSARRREWRDRIETLSAAADG